MKSKLTKQDKEKLSNKTVFFTSCALLYALLLLFIEKMASSSITVEGAVALIQFLRWASLAGAMFCAAWSAYKEKKGFFLYCSMFLYVFVSTLVLHYVPGDRAYLVNYIAMGVAFAAGEAYYYLKVAGYLNKGGKGIKFFTAACVFAVLLLAVACLPLQMLHKVI